MCFPAGRVSCQPKPSPPDGKNTPARLLAPPVALTWLVLFRFARDGVARVSKATIAERLGMSERHVARMIDSLEGQKLIKVVKRAEYKQGSNIYQLGIRPLEKSQKPRRHRSGTGPESEEAGGLVESAERVQPVVTPSPESCPGDSAI